MTNDNNSQVRQKLGIDNIEHVPILLAKTSLKDKCYCH